MFECAENEYPPTSGTKNRGKKGESKHRRVVDKQADVVPTPNTDSAKVIAKTKNGKTGINFKGFGVLIDTPSTTYTKGDLVNVSFLSDIGKPDFRITEVR